LKTLLKNAREQKQLKTRELAQLLAIDQALVSKFEKGSRRPTKEQVVKLASILEIDYETIMILWLKEKIIHEIGDEKLALQALKEAQAEIKILQNTSLNTISKALQKLLDEVDLLKAKLDKFRQFESNKVTQTLDLEFTFETNRLEGNTLTLQEIELVINQGLTIAGKTMKEHLAVINDIEAVGYIKGLIEKNIAFQEKELLTIHHLLARGIQLDDAGRYRKTEINSDVSNFRPNYPTQLNKLMEDFFNWYESHKNSIHPLLLAAETHLRLILIQPFETTNGKVARLVQNLILLQHGYIMANNKGDAYNIEKYKNSIHVAQNNGNNEDFLLLVTRTEKECLERYIGLIAQ
jgi:Fic family protein